MNPSIIALIAPLVLGGLAVYVLRFTGIRFLPSSIRVAFALIVVVLGLGPLLAGAQVFRTGHATESWKSVSGEIISVSRVRSKFTTTDSSPLDSANIQYRYVVGDKTYVGTRLFMGYALLRGEPAADIVARYYSGQQGVKVFYDPATPSEAVLEPGVGLDATYLLAVGLGVVLAGLIGMPWEGSNEVVVEKNDRERSSYPRRY